MLIAACAAAIRPFGAARLPVAAPQLFSLGETRRADVAEAVRGALRTAGYRETADAPLRVEITFAVRPPGVAVAGTAGMQLLCHREAYVLTVAMIDRASGTVLRRSGAITARCRGKEGEALPLLARAAISPAP